MDSPPSERSPKASPSPANLLLVLTLGLLLGQGATPIGEIPPLAVLLSAAGCLIIPLYFAFRRDAQRALAAFFLVLAFSLGYWMHYRVLYPSFAPNHLRLTSEPDGSLYIEGLLYREPETLPDRSRWYLRAQRIWHPTGAEEVQGNVLITVRRATSEWHYGDRVRLWLRVRAPRNSGNPGGFDYESYLARRQIYLTGFLETDTGVELVLRDGRGLWTGIERLRREVGRFFTIHLPHESAVLMKALVVGDMGGISTEMRDAFTAAGVAHVLSISGLHVGMLGLVAFLLVRFFGSFSTALLLRWNLLKVAAIASFVAVVFYTALAGGMIPTVRSAIMIGAYQLAVILDREEEVFNSLALAALLSGLIWPGVLLDISFQLSFLAVLVIVWGLRTLQRWRPARRPEELPQERRWWRNKLRPVGLYLAVPFLATLGTGPLIAYHFGQIPLAGFLSNPLIVPVVGFVIVPLGLLMAFLSLSIPVLAAPFLWLADLLVTMTCGAVRVLAGLPMAEVSTPSPNLLEVAILYLMLAAFLSVYRRAHLYLVSCALVVGVAGDGWYWRQQRWDRSVLRVTFLSVGHGDAAAVEFPRSKVLLIDAGGSANAAFDPGDSIIVPFLRSRRISAVDYLLVSHPRVDHYGGMQAIVEQFSPAEFWTGASKIGTTRYRELEEAVRTKGTKRVLLSDRDSCREIEQVSVCVLFAPQDGMGDASVVMRLSYGRVSFLFPGDIETKQQRLLLERKKELQSQIVKVPRHGSLTAGSEDFIASVGAKLAVFSVGHRHALGLPKEEVVSRYRSFGSEILRTDEDGAIMVETDGERIRYRTYRSKREGVVSP